ncbi:MAG: multidrug transporter MatE, partial [Oscillospiraceae bacterium]|nr:multidrug transporter MatE [Oscillospiraceae bacterium]
AMGIITILFNRQIVKYLGADALAVYGIIISIRTFVQNASYSIGQASQPLFSANYGAGQHDRIKQTLKYAVGTSIVFGILWTGIACAIPNVFVRIFMNPTEAIFAIAPGIMQRYCSSFLLLSFNVFSTFYFQSLSKNGVSFAISVTRGAIVSGALIMLMPPLFGAESIWYAMPVTELVVAIYAIYKMKKCTDSLR